MKPLPTPVAGLFVVLLSIAAAQPALGASLPPPNVDISKWPQMSSKAFGCYLEKTFGYRDKRFHCGMKKYEPEGNVCTNAKGYYEGPEFPRRLAAKVHPLATDVQLDWESGGLQSVSVTLKGRWNEKELRKVFGLPPAQDSKLTDAQRKKVPENLLDTRVHYSPNSVSNEYRADADEVTGRLPDDPARGTTDIWLAGYEHMGAGDVDCGDAE